MKKNIFCCIIFILLFSGCSRHSNYTPQQSENVAGNLSVSAENNKDIEKNTKQEEVENDSWNAYQTILSGDFSLIEDHYFKSEMEFLYKLDTQNKKCGWKYILMDFNKDSSYELFIQFDIEHNSALFGYINGKIKGVYIDDLEATCFIQPLKNGSLLETYNYWIAPTKTIYEFDSEFNIVNQKQYVSITVDDYKYYKEHYNYIIENHPIITKEGVYYFQTIDGKEINLSQEEWEQIQIDIDKKLIPDIEWKACSELNTN